MWARTEEAGAHRALRYRHEPTKHCTLQVLLFMYHIPYKYHLYWLPIHSVCLECDAVQSGTCTTALQNVLAAISLQIHALRTTQQPLPYHTVQKYHNIHPCSLIHRFLNAVFAWVHLCTFQLLRESLQCATLSTVCKNYQ